MPRVLVVLIALLAVAGPVPAHAGPRARTAAATPRRAAVAPRARTRPSRTRGQSQLTRIQRLPNPWRALSPGERRVVRDYHKERQAWIRARGTMFRRITVDRDYSHDYVLQRTRSATAFLDWSDPQHPLFDPKRKTGEQHLLDPIPVDRRAHILIVPNQPREHIAGQLGDQITGADLKVAQRTVAQAERLARKLGIKNARVWINSPDRISVGYLHVHLIGERTRPYPPALHTPRRQKARR